MLSSTPSLPPLVSALIVDHRRVTVSLLPAPSPPPSDDSRWPKARKRERIDDLINGDVRSLRRLLVASSFRDVDDCRPLWRFCENSSTRVQTHVHLELNDGEIHVAAANADGTFVMTKRFLPIFLPSLFPFRSDREYSCARFSCVAASLPSF